jgi:hypothetical protein
MKNKQDIHLNINGDDSNINDFLYCYKEFGILPNRYIIHSDISYNDFLTLIEDVSDVYRITEIDGFRNEKILSKYNDNIYFSYFILEAGTEYEAISNLSIFYKNQEDLYSIKKILEDISLEEFYDEDESESKTSKNVNIVNILSGSINISKIESLEKNENIDLFYNEKTFKSINKLTKKIKKTKKGLSMFIGERGSGKTSIISYISEKIDKQVIYIPNNLIEHTINNPEFKNLLRNYKNSVIVIDDCDVIFSDIYTKSNIITSNLLQIIDGLDSNDYGINFLLIFNCHDESEIDDNLLECNNLLDVIKFEMLSKEESNDLSNHLDKKTKYKQETKLIDILNQNKIKKEDSIGF